MQTHEWFEVRSMEGHVWWVRGPCLHSRPVPVHTATGEHVADLCPDCDAQLPVGVLAEDG